MMQIKKTSPEGFLSQPLLVIQLKFKVELKNFCNKIKSLFSLFFFLEKRGYLEGSFMTSIPKKVVQGD